MGVGTGRRKRLRDASGCAMNMCCYWHCCHGCDPVTEVDEAQKPCLAKESFLWAEPCCSTNAAAAPNRHRPCTTLATGGCRQETAVRTQGSAKSPGLWDRTWLRRCMSAIDFCFDIHWLSGPECCHTVQNLRGVHFMRGTTILTRVEIEFSLAMGSS